MDVRVVGRERVEEQAILEELSGEPRPVRVADRRWMLAVAAIAGIVCMGFAGDLVSPKPIDQPARVEMAQASGDPSASPVEPAPPMDVEVLGADGVVTDGLVPLRVRMAPDHNVHLSVAIGRAVVGWRDVTTSGFGSWEGIVEVFVPTIELPATVHAGTREESAAVEVVVPFELDGGPAFTIWDASVIGRPDGGSSVAYRAFAPLTFTHVDAWVTDTRGRRLGAASSASGVEEWRAGSAGARELGLGSVVGEIELRRRSAGALTLHVAWRDASTGATGTLERILEPR
jgi:hypothetical protein